MKRHVISNMDLPLNFGLSFWLLIFIFLDKMVDTDSLWWIVYGVFLIAWTILFGLLKFREKHFSVISFKQNIEKWISE